MHNRKGKGTFAYEKYYTQAYQSVLHAEQGAAKSDPACSVLRRLGQSLHTDQLRGCITGTVPCAVDRILTNTHTCAHGGHAA